MQRRMDFPLRGWRWLLAAMVAFGTAAAPAQLVLSEFMASNGGKLDFHDEDGDYEDWIEIQNLSPATVDLSGWSLTDDPGDLTKWQFPATNLPPSGLLVVFASDKNRRTPGEELHTNFRLSAAGEYLALVDSSGTNIVTEFVPGYPGQVRDVSFGFGLAASNVTLVATGATVRVLVPSAANGGSTLGDAWTGHPAYEPFNTAGWLEGATGVGFNAGAAGEVSLDISSSMLNQNASVFIRIAFVVDDPAGFSLLTLRIKYDDGFVAWINGVELARANTPSQGLAWDSRALRAHAASAFEDLAFGLPPDLLRGGTNLLAIQGLNQSAADESFLVLPGLEATQLAGNDTRAVYFTMPTPGVENLGGSAALGPGIAEVTHAPQLPLDQDDLTVTARIFPTLQPVAAVSLHYRVMFDNEKTLFMFDDGAHGDDAAGDGVYGARIPAGESTSSQMVRYRITAKDVDGTESCLPLFCDPNSTAQYFGTVIDPGYVVSRLPVLHLFAPSTILQPGPTTSQTGADSKAGAKVAVYYDGEFYDNVQMQLRGNTTAGYNKKSHRLEFNREHPFRYSDSAARIRKTSFVADYPDPTYMRQGLSYRLCTETGAAGPFYAPFRLQLNGQFYQLANHNDVHGEELLERLGYDPNGALYNAVGTVQYPIDSTGGFEKKTRDWDDDADYAALANAISEALPVEQRRVGVFDRLDLPQVISYVVAARLVHENDDVWANMSLYHDNDGDDLWRVIPFDMNLSWGAAFVDADAFVGIQVDDDRLKSFPLYGGSESPPSSGPTRYNQLYDALYEVPETREMIRRRMRSVLDQWFTPPGTPSAETPVGRMAEAWRDLIAEEAERDRAWWKWPALGGQCNFPPGIGLAEGVDVLLEEYIGRRRIHLYGKHSVTNTALPVGISKAGNAGIPLAQPANAIVSISGLDYNPVSGNQDEEYVELSNAHDYAVDISGWQLAGGIRFQFRAGTVVPAGGNVYVSPDVRAFRGRLASPRGGEGRFVVGPYDGRLSAWGESLSLVDDTGRLVSSRSYPGTPSPAQRYLRVTEILYNPAPMPSVTDDEQQFEFIELKNISSEVNLDLAGVEFSSGIRFAFAGSAITSLAPGACAVVVRDPAAFEARYGTGLPVAGVYDGHLDNAGERLRLDDAHGEKILEFAYDDAWYPLTDGLGFSLVVVDDQAPWDTWGQREQWRVSGMYLGTPGTADPGPVAVAAVKVNEALTRPAGGLVDAIELYNPETAPVDIGGWFLSDERDEPSKYRIPDHTILDGSGFRVFDARHFGSGPTSFGLSAAGEEVYLFSADAAGKLTGYLHGFSFGAAANGVSFGRHVTSVGEEHFVAQNVNTLGFANAPPRVGPVVISEVMYHPPDAGGADNDGDEYIELANITGSAVALYDANFATNTWRLDNAVEYTFPAGAAIPPGGRLLIVGFDPADGQRLAAFHAACNLDPSVAVYGPWSGKLDNSGETIELKRPETPDLGVLPYILVEELAYRDAAPWPVGPDGGGASLQRVAEAEYGNDPVNWAGWAPSPARANLPNTAPSVVLTSPEDGASADELGSLVLAAEAGDADGGIEYVEFRANGQVIHTDRTFPYSHVWTHPPVGMHRLDARAVDNLLASSVSPVRMVQVRAVLPTVTWLSPTGDVGVGVGIALRLEVAAADPDGAIAAVAMFDSGQTLGLDSAAPYEWTFVPTAIGSHDLYAVATDDSGHAVTSRVIRVQAVPAAVTNQALIAAGAVWRYRDTGTEPGPDWARLEYDNSGWSIGPAELGYGDGDEATEVRYGFFRWFKHVTTHFRRTFAADMLAGVSGGTLRLKRDDGAVVYLNGQEIHRVNMPPGVITYQTLASTSVDGTAESRFFESAVDLSALRSGDNVVAVEIHQVTRNSDDISFDLGLTAHVVILAPYIIRQPADFALPAGGAGTFSVEVGGTAPIGFQWLKDGVPVTGATGPALAFTNVDASHAGSYRLAASNSVGSALSDAAVLTVGMPGDADGDGLPDDWESAHGVSPSRGEGDDGPDGDPDGDGASNFEEYLAGTHPQDPTSVLAVLAITPDEEPNHLVVTYPAASNRTTVLEWSPTLPGTNWSILSQALDPPANQVVTVTNSPPDPRGTFYRLSVPAP